MGDEQYCDFEIANLFTYHAPDQEQIDKIAAIREQSKHLAGLINEAVPDGDFKRRAIEGLHTVSMTANAGIVIDMAMED